MDSKSHLCAVCNNPATQSCGHCKAIWYCGDKCRIEDRVESHRLVCLEYVKFISEKPRPHPTLKFRHLLAILFPENADKPQFLWVKIEIHHEGVNYNYEVLQDEINLSERSP